ncbi:MAG: hypothetical protein U9R49_11765 [Bacteroidota bacterium]|nr:hypothetical protein [Bacteroidota bacterium]
MKPAYYLFLRLLVIVRSTGEPGTIKVEVNSDGLEPGSISLEVK